MATSKTPEKNKNKAWAQYVRDRRKASGKSRRQLAADAQIDPSYWTLIERDGNIPTRAIVIRPLLEPEKKTRKTRNRGGAL